MFFSRVNSNKAYKVSPHHSKYHIETILKGDSIWIWYFICLFADYDEHGKTVHEELNSENGIPIAYW